MTCEEELERLKNGIREFLESDIAFKVYKPWREDGVLSKHDTCQHENYRWEGCERCTELYFEELLNG